MTEALDVVARLAVASLAGLGVGMEREWSGHASGPEGRFAGIRTFFLYGLTSGVAGVLADAGLMPLAAVLLSAQGAFAVAAWVMAVPAPVSPGVRSGLAKMRSTAASSGSADLNESVSGTLRHGMPTCAARRSNALPAAANMAGSAPWKL